MNSIAKLVIFGLFIGTLTAKGTVPSCAQWVSARTFDEVARELHGGNNKQISPESRLGRYLAQSGAAIKYHRFADGTGGFGPEKPIVAVSPDTFPLFSRLFGSEYANGFEHLHTPGQGTLLTRWMTHTFSYATLGGEWRFPQVGSIGPIILLSDNEANRIEKYWALNETGSHICRAPNMIPGYGYPADAYIGNCTAWVGHIPLGDETYETVTSAGSIDQWGDGAGSSPRVGTLTDYPAIAGIDETLLREVWGNPLRKRLWDILEIPFELANHTNPGWVAISLTALAKDERVPFVVAYVENATQIPEPFESSISAVGP
jgi:hypothetical protein